MQSIGLTAPRIVLLITVDSKRTDTKLHPRLHTMDSLVQLFDKQIHLMTSPVALVTIPLRIGTELSLVRNLNTRHRIRIEIVVNMQAVNIISRQDIFNNATNIVTILL